MVMFGLDPQEEQLLHGKK
jgi:hypothetical protein